MSEKEIEQFITTWESQGRSEEQRWAVRNFMTGQGLLMVQALITQAERRGAIRERAELRAWVKEHMERNYNDNTFIMAGDFFDHVDLLRESDKEKTE